MLEAMAKESIEQAQRQSSEIVKKLVVSTMQMQRQEIGEEGMGLLAKERQERTGEVGRLKEQRRELKRLLDGQSSEECRWLSQLKEANL